MHSTASRGRSRAELARRVLALVGRSSYHQRIARQCRKYALRSAAYDCLHHGAPPVSAEHNQVAAMHLDVFANDLLRMSWFDHRDYPLSIIVRQEGRGEKLSKLLSPSHAVSLCM